ncbi:hypothetical protein [Amycolatopsis tolypomycina]|uniref:Uncharacterized protein n=1 Tax=Amycolatopsis tolypomycina TaxID=208445 RepID=A0A1H4XEP8_9PSEU|nr:hypothetical protein [Amycolatopsis tolypomycina]SED03630.1 hypothetical protein SAMN04489727_6110 [Amycolatopsis tolypomycina]
MRRLSAVVLLVALGTVACGRNQQVPRTAEALCSPSYEPRELVVRGPLYPALPSLTGRAPAEDRTTDVAAIRNVAAAACGLPEPPSNVACTADLGPGFELRFLDARGRTTTVTAAGYGCQFVEGLGPRRFDARPLWAALTAAGLPAPHPR